MVAQVVAPRRRRRLLWVLLSRQLLVAALWAALALAVWAAIPPHVLPLSRQLLWLLVAAPAVWAAVPPHVLPLSRKLLVAIARAVVAALRLWVLLPMVSAAVPVLLVPCPTGRPSWTP